MLKLPFFEFLFFIFFILSILSESVGPVDLHGFCKTST